MEEAWKKEEGKEEGREVKYEFEYMSLEQQVLFHWEMSTETRFIDNWKFLFQPAETILRYSGLKFSPEHL